VKILCLSTYPVEEPRHGGQHRLANVIAAFRRNGHEVRSAGVIGSPAYKLSRYFVDYPGNDALSRVIKNLPLMEDLAISRLFVDDARYFKSLAEKIDYAPDIIYVEQPWLSAFGKKFNEQYCSGRSILCYGSANIEHLLKYQIIKHYFGEEQAVAAREDVLACEVDAITSASHIFCVSKNDLDWTAKYVTRPPILAANGVIDRQANPDDVVAANQITQGQKFALYCASAHPPNITGFFDMFGYGAGCVPPDARLVVAGSAGSNLAHDDRMRLTGSLQRQYIDAGEVSEEVLRGLLATAHQIILPITVGGGTNLKSAEALWSGQHVVGTTTAMRGFEQFIGAPGVAVADDGRAFCNAIRQAFMEPKLSLSAEERDRRRSVLWENTLWAMTEAVNAMEVAA
jgi:hypothetical protein